MSDRPNNPAINQRHSPDDCIYHVGIASAYGGGNLYLNRKELDEYNRDPDGYAAAYFGFETSAEYREWIRCDGAALCSERTKSGQLCRTSIGRCYDPREWLEKHRSRPCSIHEERCR